MDSLLSFSMHWGLEMEQTEEFQERLRATARLIAPIADGLRQLPREQIEEVVLFLKKIHNPPNEREEEWGEIRRFEARVEGLRNLPEQVQLQRLVIRKVWLAIACGAGAGICATLAVVTGFVAHAWLLSSALLFPIVLMAWQGTRQGVQSISISKEQDQRHLLASIREATCVTEINRAGLFAWSNDAADFKSRNYNEKAAAECTQKQVLHLRDAIYRHAYEEKLSNYLE
jgi:hypothetical protein